MILHTFVLSCLLARRPQVRDALPDTFPSDTAHAHQHDPDAEHEHGGHHHEHGLHFSHPIITESVSPDTKVRVDYARSQPNDAAEVEVEGEYAFTRGFSIEAGAGHETGDDSGSEVGGSLKFAGYWWEEQGILLGGGVSLRVPLGDATAADDAAEVLPFVNAGLRMDAWEFIGAAQLGVRPADQGSGTRLGWNASALYHLSPRIEPMLEYRGAGGLSGTARGGTTHAIAPGVKVRPFAPLMHIGASVLIPVGGEREFQSRLLLSAFYHF